VVGAAEKALGIGCAARTNAPAHETHAGAIRGAR
jgi:hypothetical protein